MQEQRQLEWLSTRSRPDVGDVLSFCSAQAGFRTCRRLYKIFIVTNHPCGFTPFEFELSHPSRRLCFSGVPVDNLVIRGSPTEDEEFTIKLDRVAIKKEEVGGVLLCVQDFVRSPHFTQRNFFSETGLTMLSESVAIADSITLSSFDAPWSVVESAFGIGWCCVVVLPKTLVSAGIMVAPSE